MAKSEYKPSPYDGKPNGLGGFYGIWRPPVKAYSDFSGLGVYRQSGVLRKSRQLDLPLSGGR